jgi:hypothetical protein
MIVFGGFTGLVHLNDVWSLSLSGTPAWSPLTPTGTPPAIRLAPSAVYDPVQARMVVFGGRNNSGQFNDTWSLSLTGTPAWNLRVPSGTPPTARYSAAAAYDAVHGRMVVFGGAGATIQQDTWALAWEPIAPLSVPDVGSHGITALRSVTPNPSADAQLIELVVAEQGRLDSIDVFDVQGIRVWHRDLRSFAPGTYRLVWNGRTRAGTMSPPGVYYASVRAAQGTQTRRLVRLR